MQFLDFCRAHGILINSMPPLGVWRRYPTEDHPAKRNGAIKWMGEVAFLQNWAISTEVVVWKTDKANPVDLARYRRDAQAAERKRLQQQDEAAKKAQWILSQCQYGYHPYLASKGFPEEQANVWKSDDGLVLVIPMRVGHRLVGCQLIREDGSKKFLFGQRTSNAEYIMDAKGPHVLCEGYATALSIKQALVALKRKFTLHVCFSAGNMKKIAETLPGGVVVADNDASQTGQRTAEEIGWPYWISDVEGEDFNDYARRVKTFKASQSLLRSLSQTKSPV